MKPMRSREAILEEWNMAPTEVQLEMFLLETQLDLRDQNTEIISLLTKLVERNNADLVAKLLSWRRN